MGIFGNSATKAVTKETPTKGTPNLWKQPLIGRQFRKRHPLFLTVARIQWSNLSIGGEEGVHHCDVYIT